MVPNHISMASLQSHLSVLEASASKYSSVPVFKVPGTLQNSQVDEWLSISYLQFAEDVELYARYWSSVLALDGIPKRSVVGLWYVLPRQTQ